MSLISDLIERKKVVSENLFYKNDVDLSDKLSKIQVKICAFIAALFIHLTVTVFT